jgi:GTP-binding protein of the ras superfamily involved in termination of M-phase
MDTEAQSICQEAQVVLFVFDLERPTTLNSIRDWYRHARKCNKTFRPFLVGGKYDLFTQLPSQQQMEITQRSAQVMSSNEDA